MTEESIQSPPTEHCAPGESIRNPYILNFCRILVEKKGESHQPEALEKLLSDMYSLFEYMLGQNMIQNLPEDLRNRYLNMCQDLSSLNYEKIGEIFDANIPHYRDIMKETMKQFADIFMKNRRFDKRDYPVPADV